jgi:putative ABC transport system permease protein
MLQDVRLALRSLARERGFAVTTILTIALGIALTTTMVSVADNVMLRPLPYPQAQRLYEIFGANRGDLYSRVSGAVGDYRAWRETGVFSSIGVFKYGSLVAIGGGKEPRRVLSVPADELLLPTLGVQPAIGRGFTEDDCREGARPVAIISAGLWRSDFGAEASVLGRIIDIDDRPAEIIGVLPQDFLFPSSVLASAPQGVQLLTPLRVPVTQRQDHNIRGYRAIGRLRDGLSVGDAQARLDAVQQTMKPLFRPGNVLPGAFDGVRLEPLLASMTGRGTRNAILFLLIAASAVLLVAVVNIANMLLARGAERARDLAVRAAIGASRLRLLRLLLVESITLSIIGGLAGFLLARLGFGIVLAMLPSRFVALRPPVMDLRIAAFAFLLSALVGAVFGLLPAWRQSRADFSHVIKQAGPTATRRGGWGRDVLIFAEIVLAVMLVGTGSLVLRSFVITLGIDPGMDSRHVLTLTLTSPARIPGADTAARSVFYRNTLDAVRGVPGVQSVALTDNLLLSGGYVGSSLSLEGVDSKRLYTRGNSVTEVQISADYFRTLGATLLRGTTFSEASSPEPVAIVSDRVGRFAGVDPLGRTVVSLGKAAPGEIPRRYRVIGVAADVRDRGYDREAASIFYLPLSAPRQATVLVRADDPAAIADAVGKAIHAIEPAAVVDQVRTLDDLVHRSLAERRFNAFLYGAFSLSALLLSAIGVYGVIAYSVSRRTREIGIRVALGASGDRILGLVTGRTLLVLLAGLIAGVAGLVALRPAVASLVFNLQPNDPATLAVAASVLLAAAATAAYIPARRATRVNTVVALRAE